MDDAVISFPSLIASWGRGGRGVVSLVIPMNRLIRVDWTLLIRRYGEIYLDYLGCLGMFCFRDCPERLLR